MKHFGTARERRRRYLIETGKWEQLRREFPIPMLVTGTVNSGTPDDSVSGKAEN